jgi:hypothetical protein
MVHPAAVFGAGVTDDPARRNTRPELRCRPGNFTPVRAKQMKRPWMGTQGVSFFCCRDYAL